MDSKERSLSSSNASDYASAERLKPPPSCINTERKTIKLGGFNKTSASNMDFIVVKRRSSEDSDQGPEKLRKMSGERDSEQNKRKDNEDHENSKKMRKDTEDENDKVRLLNCFPLLELLIFKSCVCFLILETDWFAPRAYLLNNV